MGYCYRDGVGVELDRERASDFFLKARKAIEARLSKDPEFGDIFAVRSLPN